MKPKFFELDSYDKKELRKKTPLTKDTVCSICDFPIDPKSENDWFEHFFLRNIYSKEMEKWKYLILKAIKKSYFVY